VCGRLAILAAVVVTVTSAAGLAQEAIRVDVNLATVAFTVRDADGALVDTLTKDDFEIVEDTVPQKIAYFARSADVPLTLGLIVDASGSQERFAKKHQGDLEVFLKEVLATRDRAFLVGFENHIRLVSDFSHSSGELVESWKRYEKGTQKFPEIGPPENRDLGTAFYDSIYYPVTEKLGKEEGRKALLMFSDGEDNSSSHDMMSAIDAAQGANVVVYTIRYTERAHGKLTARNQYGIRVMDRIAKETGGAAIDAGSIDPRMYFHQIAQELRTS
jgi:Ca-activated chloride channel family protein